MNLTEKKEALRNLQQQLRDKVNAGAAASTMAEITACASEANELRARMDVLRNEVTELEAATRPTHTPNNINKEGQPMSTINEIRASREYTNAFIKAVATGYKPGFSAYREEMKPIHDLLTESGNAQGGYLVPVEMDLEIQKKVKEIAPLTAEVMTRTVGSNTGWMTIGNAAAAGFTALAASGQTPRTPVDATSPFSRVPYTLTTYGLTIPVEKELEADEISNLFGYISGILADQDALLKNSLIVGKLPTSGVTATSADVLDKVKAALAVTLDPGHARNAIIITNQSGFGVLDALKDGEGRYMLQPMPTDPTTLAIRGRKVLVVPDNQLANNSTKAPIIVGDMKHYMALLTRGAMELYSEDYYQNYETRIHAFTRADTEVLDAAAAALIDVTI